jgi:hypothetical protein
MVGGDSLAWAVVRERSGRGGWRVNEGASTRRGLLGNRGLTKAVAGQRLRERDRDEETGRIAKSQQERTRLERAEELECGLAALSLFKGFNRTRDALLLGTAIRYTRNNRGCTRNSRAELRTAGNCTCVDSSPSYSQRVIANSATS